MNDSTTPWTPGEVLAWTEHDGPGRRPDAPGRVLFTTLAIGLAAAFVGVLSDDSLCPQHRMWVDVLATAALFGTVGAIVALKRGSIVAPILTVVVGLLGVAVGLLDAVHAPRHGYAVAAAFGAVTLIAAIATLRLRNVLHWGRAADRAVAGMVDEGDDRTVGGRLAEQGRPLAPSDGTLTGAPTPESGEPSGPAEVARRP